MRKQLYVVLLLLGSLTHTLYASNNVSLGLPLLTMLRDQGRARADRWLKRNFDGNEIRSSVNLAELFC